jgi:hypothetical protein
MSAILIAMLEKTENPNQTMDTEKTNATDRNLKVKQRLASVLMDSFISTTNIMNNYKDIVDMYIDNPFYVIAESDVIKFRVEIENGIELPHFISYFMFNTTAVVKAIEIKGTDIIIWYTDNGGNNPANNSYTIELDSKRLPIKDLIILIYILYNLPKGKSTNFTINSETSFTLSLQWYKDFIKQELNEMVEMLKNNGIEINQ